jgi:RsiW-degrading membrane proteinase PrsW (M82 family)
MRLQSRTCAGRSLVGGVVLLLIGVVFLLLNLGVFQSMVFRTWWPLLLIVLGLTKLFGRSWWNRPRGPYSDFA